MARVVAELWRGILLRRPTWRAVREVRRDSRGGLTPDEVEQQLRAEIDKRRSFWRGKLPRLMRKLPGLGRETD